MLRPDTDKIVIEDGELITAGGSSGLDGSACALLIGIARELLEFTKRPVDLVGLLVMKTCSF